MECMNGAVGKVQCKLSSAKSTRIIEKTLLKYILDHLLTPEQLETLVVPFKLVREIAKLFERLKNSEEEALNQAYDTAITKLQKELNEVSNS
jgi:hypothetical protein